MQVVLRFALAYGFRNIQKVMRDMKRGRANYDFVEVMACPSGCLNGGGQAKAPAPTTATSEDTSATSVANQIEPNVDPKSRQSHAARLTGLNEKFQQWRKHISSMQSAPTDDTVASTQVAAPAKRKLEVSDPFVSMVYEQLAQGEGAGSSKARQWLHTRYHTVPKMEEVNPLGIGW